MEYLSNQKIEIINDTNALIKIINTLATHRSYINERDDKYFKIVCSKLIYNIYLHEHCNKFDENTKNTLTKILMAFNGNLTMHALNHVTILKLLHKMNLLHLIKITNENVNKCTSMLTFCYLKDNKLFEFAPEKHETQHFQPITIE